MNIHLSLLKATIKFIGGGVVCKVIFMSRQVEIKALLYCVWVGILTIICKLKNHKNMYGSKHWKSELTQIIKKTECGAEYVLAVAMVCWVARCDIILSKPQLNHNSTQPEITLVGLDMKITLHTTSPTQPPTT